MIWPARNLVLAALLPALLSLALLVPGTESMRPMLLALDLLIILIAIGDAFTLLGSPQLRAERTTPTTTSLGEPFTIELSILNEGQRARAVRVKDDLPPSFDADPAEFDLRVPPQGVATVSIRVVPNARGSYPLRRVDTLLSSRLGFWIRIRQLPCASLVRVYPDFQQIARYALLAKRDRLSVLGVRRSRRLGTDNEFERLRDYAEGDEPRHIDWRATARRSKLTVRAHQVNQSQRVLFLIDSGRMMAGDVGGGRTPLDHAFDAMLMLAHVALSRGDQVGLLVYADRVRAYVPPAGGSKRITRLVHSVHNIFPELVESRHDRAFVELERRCRKRSLVIHMTNLFDELNAAQLVAHLSNVVGRHLPLGVILRDHDLFALADNPATFGRELFDAAAAASMLNERERALATLRQRGVLTLDVFPEELTAPLINSYLDVKARHLL